jgi:hypothetical protein
MAITSIINVLYLSLQMFNIYMNWFHICTALLVLDLMVGQVTFLRYIRQWGKKVVFILNKSDVLSTYSEVCHLQLVIIVCVVFHQVFH